MREALKILLISFVFIIVVGFIGLKVLWYYGNYGYRFDEDMKPWETLSLKEAEYILKFYTGPKLKIMGKGIYNQPAEGASDFSNKGLYYNCNQSECDTKFYYYDGEYVYFLNTNHEHNNIFSVGTEEKYKVIADEGERLILNGMEFHTFKYEKGHRY